MIPLLNALIVEGRELTAIEDVVIDLFIGFVVFVGLALLVLRHQSLRRDQYQQIINEEKSRLDTAISHMSQGLVMFDASHRVALRNRRYCELYGLAPEIVKSGLSFRDLLILRKEAGSLVDDVDEILDRVNESLAKGQKS